MFQNKFLFPIRKKKRLSLNVPEISESLQGQYLMTEEPREMDLIYTTLFPLKVTVVFENGIAN